MLNSHPDLTAVLILTHLLSHDEAFFSDEKLNHMGEEASLEVIYKDQTALLKFTNGEKLDFPFEAIKEQVNVATGAHSGGVGDDSESRRELAVLMNPAFPQYYVAPENHTEEHFRDYVKRQKWRLLPLSKSKVRQFHRYNFAFEGVPVEDVLQEPQQVLGQSLIHNMQPQEENVNATKRRKLIQFFSNRLAHASSNLKWCNKSAGKISAACVQVKNDMHSMLHNLTDLENQWKPHGQHGSAIELKQKVHWRIDTS